MPSKVVKPTLIIDTREKVPWDFEGDSDFEDVIYCKLDVGDYSIAGMEDIITIERKAGADELFNNFSQNKQRIYAEIDRMQNHKIKVIVIEQTLEDILNPDSYYINTSGKNKRSPRMPPAVVASNLTDIILKHNVQVIYGGYKAQSMARGLLLRAYELYRKNQL
jgi:ERCC4-type nuclease